MPNIDAGKLIMMEDAIFPNHVKAFTVDEARAGYVSSYNLSIVLTFRECLNQTRDEIKCVG